MAEYSWVLVLLEAAMTPLSRGGCTERRLPLESSCLCPPRGGDTHPGAGLKGLGEIVR